MKRIIENKCIFILGLIVGLIISVGGVYAATAIIESKEVAYDNSNSHGTYTNVQDTIDELYERSGLRKTKWTDPILNDLLIPVVIDSDGNTYYANEYTEWYNYKEKRWANAVILTDTAREYKDDEEYKVGDKIEEDDIESYFVWIPRYQYKIWTLANTEEFTKTIAANTLTNSNYLSSMAQAMNKSRIIYIKFGNINKTPKMAESAASVGEYYTHPAFTLGSKELNGIWVGKFETGYKGAKATNQAQVNEEEKDSVIIKPSVYSWRYINVKNMFLTSFNYKRSLDSHMLKNTEWGAVAYLSHSEYGIANKININNSSNYFTGYSSYNSDQSTFPGTKGDDDKSTKAWDTETGYLASTTGNITGIYDMSGGNHEYVAAYKANSLGDSGFTDENELAGDYAIYVDKYPADSVYTSYNNRILGDATGEMGPFYDYLDGNGRSRPHNAWYSETSHFVAENNPWFGRGGDMTNGRIGGQFAFGQHTGGPYNTVGFRIALALEK